MAGGGVGSGESEHRGEEGEARWQVPGADGSEAGGARTGFGEWTGRASVRPQNFPFSSVQPLLFLPPRPPLPPHCRQFVLRHAPPSLYFSLLLSLLPTTRGPCA